MKEIILGTNNRHKVKEIQSILNNYLPAKIKLILPAQILGECPEVEETGSTLEENAYIKADYYARLTGLPCFADDSALEIDALNGEPGVISARYAGEYGNDKANRIKVLELMNDVRIDFRKAKFRTVICFVDNDLVKYIEGTCPGSIITVERGQAGFGYDPIFVPDGFDLTFAEMEPELKNSISHRYNAVKNFADYLVKEYFA